MYLSSLILKADSNFFGLMEDVTGHFSAISIWKGTYLNGMDKERFCGDAVR